LQALYRTLGSIGFVAAARAVWLVGKHPENDNRRIMSPTKNNLSKNPKPIAFTLKETKVKIGKEFDNIPKCQFEWGTVYETADEILQTQLVDSSSRREEAKTWLRTLLSDGPKPSTEIKHKAEEKKIAQRTLRRAREELGVITHPVRDKKGTKWLWRLPTQR